MSRSAGSRCRGRGRCGGRRGRGRAPGTRRGRASRASPRGPRAEAATSRASGYGSLGERRRGPCALRSRPASAPHGLAGLAARRLDRVAGVRLARSPGGRLVEPLERGAAAEDEALAERVGGEPVGAVQAGAGALADGVEALDAGRAPVEVGDDPAHHVVAGGGDRDALRRRVQARPPAGRRRCSGSGPGRPSSCRARRGRAGALQQLKIARATASRGASSSTKRSPSGPCSVAPSPRTASEIRKPSRPLRPTTAVGWNWVNSRSASIAPAWRASSRPEPNEPGGLVVRDHSAAAPPVARIVARAVRSRPSSSRTPPSLEDRRRAVAFEHLDAAGARPPRAESARRMRRPVALPPAWMIRRRLWPPSRPSARSPWRSASKLHAELAAARATRAAASSVSTSAAARRVSPRPAIERVLEVQLAASRRSRARRRRRPAPSRTRSRPAGGRRRA